MNGTNEKQGRNSCSQQATQLSPQSEAFLRMLTQRGILEDPDISDDAARQAAKERKRNVYHNTALMLQNYRNISWALECFPSYIAAELDKPMGNLDALLSLISAEIGMENIKLENRLMNIQKSRLLLDRVNEALTILKRKPGNGEQMYKLIYLTYVVPEKLMHSEILFRLGLSSRQYYRIRQQAVNILSIRLWATPNNELDSWLEVLTMLQTM